MRILLLTHSFNSLSQRLFGLLRAQGHEVSVELDIADSVTEEAVTLFRPDLVLAPFLQRRIPASVWSRTVCLVVHPGVPGDQARRDRAGAVAHSETCNVRRYALSPAVGGRRRNGGPSRPCSCLPRAPGRRAWASG